MHRAPAPAGSPVDRPVDGGDDRARRAAGAPRRHRVRRIPRVRRVLAIGAVALAAGLGLTGCLPPPENGRLPDSSLTTVTSGCRTAGDVAPRLFRMLYDAALLRVPLWPETKSYAIVDPPRITSCYRDYDMQVWWRDYWCFFGLCNMAAVPGTSIHGWGRAADFECGGQEMTFESSCYAFLKYFGAAYGFFHPAWAEPGQPGAEAWHWEAY